MLKHEGTPSARSRAFLDLLDTTLLGGYRYRQPAQNRCRLSSSSVCCITLSKRVKLGTCMVASRPTTRILYVAICQKSPYALCPSPLLGEKQNHILKRNLVALTKSEVLWYMLAHEVLMLFELLLHGLDPL